MFTINSRLLLALSILPKVGRQTIRKLLSASTGSLQPDLDLLQSMTGANNYRLLKNYLQSSGELYERVCTATEVLHQLQIRCINYTDIEYPPLLLQIPDYPLLLFCKGDQKILSKPQIAIVGSRQASRSSLRHAYSFSRQLAQSGLVITSGLARGIDGAAHSGAVDNNFPSIAVMGTGLDVVYPRVHQKMAGKLLKSGCWLSEYLPGTAPLAGNFPQRNRIISGLALGVLIVEAKLKSGTLITARMALEQNRDVFAIPGPIEYSGSVGCHQLISDGAVLVQSANDILSELNFSDQVMGVNEQATDESTKTLAEPLYGLLSNIDYSHTSLVQIASQSQSAIASLTSSLVELELLGFIQSSGDGYTRLK